MQIAKRMRRALAGHMEWARTTKKCSVPGCTSHSRIEFHHEPPVSRGSESSDALGCPLCAEHHAERHALGLDIFNSKHRINLWMIILSLIELRLSFMESDEIIEEPKVPKARKTTRKNRVPYQHYTNPFK